MFESCTPSFLRPNYTWPRPMRHSLSKKTPKLPPIPSKLQRRAIGLFHELLYGLSVWYCAWWGIPFDVNIIQLPFGLVLKWNDRASIEEAVAMQMARDAGMPVPKVLSCGDHPHCSFNRTFSILMTRLPGIPLNNSSDPLDVQLEYPWLFELKECITAMREWRSPYAESTCSAMGTPLRSTRVPDHIMGPFTNQDDLHDFLLSPASGHAFSSPAEYDQALTRANDIRKCSHRITFTHGDLKAHNILVGDDNRLSGFIDWESAGWYPEYWDFTTALRFGRDSWWGQAMSWAGGAAYKEELDCDVALNSLTVDSYIAF